MRRVTCALALSIATIVWIVASGEVVSADAAHDGKDQTTIGAEVETGGAPGSGASGGTSSGGGMTLDEMIEACRQGGPTPTYGCQADIILALEDAAAADGPAVVPALLAEHAREQVDVTVPRPHTSPDGAPQLSGKRTWFWLDPGEWRTATARAELPGVWSEVTATPVRSTWTPGDGGAPVTCEGPGRPHPGTSGATTDCGHVYTVVGTYTLQVAVTYEVTWRSSTGEAGGLAPFVLTAELPVTVEQRQVVVS